MGPGVLRLVRPLAGVLLACSLLGSAAAATPTAPPPSPPKPGVCNDFDNRALIGATAPAALQQILWTAPRISERIPAEILINAPHAATVGNLRFRLFSGPVGLKQLTVDETGRLTPIMVTNTQHPAADEAKRFGIGDADSWYSVTFEGPLLPAGDWRPYSNQSIYVFACAPEGSLLASGVTHIRVFSYLQTLGGAVLFVAAVYVMIALVTVTLRVKLGRDVTVQAPMKWQNTVQLPWWRCFDPVVMCADIGDMGSLSKLQILFFTLVVLFELTKIVLRTGVLVDISPTIAYLLGIPGAGAIAGQLASNSRDRLSPANWSWLVSRGVLPLNDRGAEPPRWRDVFTSNEEVDFYKVQAAAFSLVVGIGMLQTPMIDFGSFKVPESLLEILGMSQLVMVGGRFTTPTTLGDLDKLVTELKLRLAALRAAASSGLDVDADGKPLTPPAPPSGPDAGAGGQPAPPPPAPLAKPSPYATLAAAGAPGAVPEAVSRYLDTAKEVQALLQSLADRTIDAEPLLNPSLTVV